MLSVEGRKRGAVGARTSGGGRPWAILGARASSMRDFDTALPQTEGSNVVPSSEDSAANSRETIGGDDVLAVRTGTLRLIAAEGADRRRIAVPASPISPRVPVRYRCH